MYCWKCGAQVEDGSRFCSKCGANLQQIPQAPQEPAKRPAAAQPVSQPAAGPAARPAQQKKGGFKRFVITALIVGVCYLVGSYLGEQFGNSTKSSGSSSRSVATTAPKAQKTLANAVSSANTDVLTQHIVLVDDPKGEYRQYHVLYYGNTTRRLKAWTIELAGAKSAGYTVNNMLSSIKVNEWPSFAAIRNHEYNGYAVVSLSMKNLDSAARIRELIKYDLIASMPESEIAKGALDVDSLADSIKSLGYSEASLLDYPMLNLSQQ